MNIDPKSLKIFISAVRLGTIAAAAEAEHLAAAAASRRLSELEHAVGAEVLVRSSKGVKATPAGQALLALSHRVLNDLADIQSQMREFATGTKGYVRVFANISAITQFLPQELSRFMTQHPLVQVHLEERVSSRVAQAIAENQADIGVLVKDGAMEGVEFLPYKEDEVVVIVPKSHALARKSRVRLEQTLDFDYVGLPPGSQLNAQLALAARAMDKVWRSRFQVPSYDVLCLMVEAGLGVGILPRRIAVSHAKALNIKVLKLDEPWAHRELHLCIRSYDALSTTARLLVDGMVGKAGVSRA